MKIEKEEIKPVCPYCEAKLERLTQVKASMLADHKVICCSRCHKILHITDK